MRLLIDMNLTPRWLSFWRAPGIRRYTGHPCSTSTKDAYIREFARLHTYVILTNDLDFPQILAHTRRAAPSIVLLRGEPLVPEVRGFALLDALKACESDLNQGAIVTLDWLDRLRSRVLPLR